MGILLIDDSPVQLSVRQAILEREGFSVFTETSGTMALERVRAHLDQIDAVITDHLMPEMSGLEFVRQLRSSQIQVPVIVISGQHDADEEYAGLNVRFQMKPYPAQELIALVRSLIGKRKEKAS